MTRNLPSYQHHHSLFLVLCVNLDSTLSLSRFFFSYTNKVEPHHQHQASQPPTSTLSLTSPPPIIILLPPPLHNPLNRSPLLLPLNPAPPHIPNLNAFPPANAASQSSSSLTPDAGPTIKNDFLHLSTVIVPGRGGFARFVETKAVVELGRREEDSFWVGVEREGLGRGDDACFAEFGRFAEVWNFFFPPEKGRDS